MKDWKRSPEPPGMMGTHAPGAVAADTPVLIPGAFRAPQASGSREESPEPERRRPRLTDQSLASMALRGECVQQVPSGRG
jgi:hypothetical protein